MTCLLQTNLVFSLFVDVAFNVTTVTCISTTDGFVFFFLSWYFWLSFSFLLCCRSLSLILSLAGFHLDRCFLSGLRRKIKHKSRCEVSVCACAYLRRTEGGHIFHVHVPHFLPQLKEERMDRNKVRQTERKREGNKECGHEREFTTNTVLWSGTSYLCVNLLSLDSNKVQGDEVCLPYFVFCFYSHVSHTCTLNADGANRVALFNIFCTFTSCKQNIRSL